MEDGERRWNMLPPIPEPLQWRDISDTRLHYYRKLYMLLQDVTLNVLDIRAELRRQCHLVSRDVVHGLCNNNHKTCLQEKARLLSWLSDLVLQTRWQGNSCFDGLRNVFTPFPFSVLSTSSLIFSLLYMSESIPWHDHHDSRRHTSATARYCRHYVESTVYHSDGHPSPRSQLASRNSGGRHHTFVDGTNYRASWLKVKESLQPFYLCVTRLFTTNMFSILD